MELALITFTSARRVRKYICCFVVALGLLLFSNTVMASHFKGGQITYKYLGGGSYEIWIKGYWSAGAVGTIFPRYEGSPIIHDSPLTVSKTLLPDGKTVEHIQKQPVTWLQPGIYSIYWKSCCRSAGSNFSNNPNGLFASVNYNPDQASSSPQFYDFPLFNFTEGEPITYNINMEDPEGHEQEYALEIPYGLTAEVYDEMLASGFMLSEEGTIAWENPIVGKWLVNVRLHEKIDGIRTGAFIEREFIIHVTSSGENTAPVFTTIQAQAVRVGEHLSFEVSASDVEGHNIILTAYGSPLENGAVFEQTALGYQVAGVFTWTPNTKGTWRMQFAATDDHFTPLSSQIIVDITVADCENYNSEYTVLAPVCAGSANGEVSLNGTGGITPYTYSLDSGATFQNSSVFKNLESGKYTGFIKDAIGCISQSVEVQLDEKPLPIVTMDLPSSTCLNSGAMELTGGSPAGGIYYGEGVDAGFFNPDQVGVGDHVLYYFYTDSNGCSGTASDDISVNEPPVADAGADATVYPGKGVNACTTLSGSASGGNLPYEYVWSTGEALQAIEVCPADTSSYILTVKDVFGCAGTDEVIVYTNESPGNGNGGGNGNGNGQGKGKGKGGNSKMVATVENQQELTAMTAEVLLYPNPIRDKSHLIVSFKEADVVTIDIIDASGRTVKLFYVGHVEANQTLSFEIDGNIGSMNFYIARVITGKGVYPFKLLIERQ